MHHREAFARLGLQPGATPAEVKAAYRKLALREHPDRCPAHLKPRAEARFKQIGEAYNALSSYNPQADGRRPFNGGAGGHASGLQARASILKHMVVGLPFFLLVGGTLCLGLSTSMRQYQKSKEGAKSRNPFLP